MVPPSRGRLPAPPLDRRRRRQVAKRARDVGLPERPAREDDEAAALEEGGQHQELAPPAEVEALQAVDVAAQDDAAAAGEARVDGLRTIRIRAAASPPAAEYLQRRPSA
jgi:hypothetical protein